MSNRLNNIANFLRNNVVLCVAAIAACISMLAVPPNATYAEYIDWRTLGLLFCLMACVQGLTQAGLFSKTGALLLRTRMGIRVAALILVGLCFIASMLVTNDVALITFVPFTLYVFTLANRRNLVAAVVVLQTIAANLGSMATPMGNPQNLFLFTHYNLGVGEMAFCVLPFTLLSAVLLAICCFVLLPRESLIDDSRQTQGRWPGRTGNASPSPDANESGSDLPASTATRASTTADRPAENAPRAPETINTRQALIFGALFVLSVLTVLNVVPLIVALVAVVVVALLANRSALKKVDYGLLVTFVCFFVFSGNLAHIAPVRDALTDLMSTAPFAASLIASQVISNVPAATLLAPFTADWQSLMLGVDIGGLGTPVASLASLISLEFFRRAHIGNTGRYLAIFSLFNVVFLAANILLGVATSVL